MTDGLTDWQVDLEKNPKGFDYYANRLRRVAVDYQGKLLFNVGDKEDFSYLLEDYDLELPDKKQVGVGIQVTASAPPIDILSPLYFHSPECSVFARRLVILCPSPAGGSARVARLDALSVCAGRQQLLQDD